MHFIYYSDSTSSTQHTTIIHSPHIAHGIVTTNRHSVTTPSFLAVSVNNVKHHHRQLMRSHHKTPPSAQQRHQNYSYFPLPQLLQFPRLRSHDQGGEDGIFRSLLAWRCGPSLQSTRNQWEWNDGQHGWYWRCTK